MSVQNRDTLKKFFEKGKLPSERNFVDLIDSVINKVDDGMTKTVEDGLMLYPIGNSQKLSSFYKSIEEKSPAWSMAIDNGNGALHFTDISNEEILTLTQEKSVGIRTTNPKAALDVSGAVALNTIRGTKYEGKVPADGKWHTIVEGLNGCHAFDIMAGVGKPKTGKYALAKATAISTFGKSKSKIKVVQGHYGTRGNKIAFRWVGSTYDFSLQIRTKSNFRGDFSINFQIMELWEDHRMDNSIGLE